MLVLSRKENESIEFPSLGVVIRVFGLTGKRVQLGIDAPISLQVTRGEKSGGERTTAKPVESIAEHVIGKEFKRLESALAAMAELASSEDQPLAQQIAAESITRISRIQRIVKSSISQQAKRMVGESIDEERLAAPEGSAWLKSGGQPTCVRQPAAGYAVVDAQNPQPQPPQGGVCVA